ncbi:MAG: VCBS repeat-containing protein, partial [Myxococcota bacterium]
MNIRARFRHHFFWLLLPLLVASGCFGAKSSDRGRRPEGSEAGPGAAAWWASDAVRCASSSECGAGESCQQGVCQVARCQEDFRSKPPLGAHRYFGRDQELMAITDGVYVEAYDGGEHIDTWYSGDEGRLTDLAVGDLDGRPPLTVVGSRVGTTELALRSGELPSRVDIGLVPEAIATGDVDRDGFDEVVAVSRDGRLAVCDFVPAIDCSHTTIEGRYDDLAVADVDGDGAAEPLLLSRGSDRSTVVGVNLDATSSGDEQTRTWDVEFEVSAFDVGYPLGPSGGVVFVLLEPVAEWDSDAIFEDGNWSAQDKLHLYEPTGRQFLTGHRFVAEEATDVVVGDTNGDGEDEVAVLDDGNHVDVYAWRTGALVKRDELDLPATHQATRLGIGDFDGDSTAVALLEGPELVAGAPVPIAVLVLPPYPAGGVLSRDQRAMVGLGFEEHDLESRDQAVSFSVNAKLAVSGKLGFFRGELAAEVGAMWESTAMQLSWLAVGGGHDLMAEPELFGNDYAG